MHDFVTNERIPTCTITRTEWTKSRLLDSSYQTEENKTSYHVTSYRMDEVPST